MAAQLAEPSLSADKALSAFLSHLEGERRLSPRTVEAYDRDLSGLFEFLTEHRNLAAPDVALALWTDYVNGGRRDTPAFLRPFDLPPHHEITAGQADLPSRQARHLT